MNKAPFCLDSSLVEKLLWEQRTLNTVSFAVEKNGRKQFCQKAPQARPFCD